LVFLTADLYGLFLFLGVDPFCVRQWWTALLYEPLCHGIKQPLYDAVSSVMWRTAKSDVLNQVIVLMLKNMLIVINVKIVNCKEGD
jgi:hypothetical protein